MTILYNVDKYMYGDNAMQVNLRKIFTPSSEALAINPLSIITLF